ncbi:MAG: peptidoglycan glycosyltransferase [Bacteroidetes bacterium]|nr:MAG: peptidoglycan glycosyltransferase [Bacteroidota bacterium]PTM10800.1 MAG: peptidoglycan glycosyltransferase [Bacteroidota bacterium]
MRKLIDQLLNGYDNPRHKNIVLWLWRLLLGGLAAVLLLFIGLSFTDLPSVTELENPKTNEASQVFAENGVLLGKYYTENRVPVAYDEIPPHLVKALIATEDIRYYDHTGIDFRGLARAVAYMGTKGGASTISQQLAKLLFTGTRSKQFSNVIFQKLREWIIAVRLERKYTKDEIIALYLNRYDFINNAKGIRAAAEIYFSKLPEDLSVDESAMLVGMLKNASFYNPRRFPERTRQRREVVLDQMRRAGYISQQDYDQYRAKPLGLHISSQTHIDGLAPYFRMILAERVKDILNRPEYRKTDGTTYDIYRDGLKIYTTINPRMQEIAEQVVHEHMAKLQKTFFTHWRNKDPWDYEYGTESEVPIERRQANLVKDVRASDRYQNLRSKYLDEITKALAAETDFDFHADDREIERMVRDEKEGDVIKGLVQDGLISSSLANKYRRVMRSSKFGALKEQWRKLTVAADQEFNKPTKMRVFAYNHKNMTADTTMTPLDSVKYHRMILQTGLMAVDPETGYVNAWVGGVDFNWFQYDHVNINTRRQVGSTFKPFVYATAIDLQSISPCQQYMDVAVTINPGDGRFYLQKPWTPRNSSGSYSNQLITLKDGLRLSKNTISVTLMKELGSPEPVREKAALMGIDKSVIPQTPSICLGAVDLSVQEMTGAYTTFANNGIYNEPTYLTRIEDRYGRLIYQSVPTEKQAIRPEANYAMTEMLQYAAERRGSIRGQFGGKTGTTNDYADGWFMGVTPNLVVGCWVGGDDRWISFRSLAFGQGAYMAKPMVLKFIEGLQADESIKWDFTKTFFRPRGDLGIELNCDAYDNPNAPSEEGEFLENGFDINNDPDFGNE